MRARTILAAGVGEAAGRNAYLATFHAAQSLIAERTGKDAKTHKGVHAQFARLTRNEPRLGSELRSSSPKPTTSNQSPITGSVPIPMYRSTAPAPRSPPASL